MQKLVMLERKVGVAGGIVSRTIPLPSNCTNIITVSVGSIRSGTLLWKQLQHITLQQCLNDRMNQQILFSVFGQGDDTRKSTKGFTKSRAVSSKLSIILVVFLDL